MPGRAKRRRVPRAKPCRDAVWLNAEMTGRFDKSIERIARIFGRVFLARETLFLVIADKPNPPLARGLDERNPGIVLAARGDAGEIDRCAAFDVRADRAKALLCERAAEPVDAMAGIKALKDRQHEIKCCPPKPRIARSGSSVSAAGGHGSYREGPASSALGDNL